MELALVVEADRLRRFRAQRPALKKLLRLPDSHVGPEAAMRRNKATYICISSWFAARGLLKLCKRTPRFRYQCRPGSVSGGARWRSGAASAKVAARSSWGLKISRDSSFPSPFAVSIGLGLSSCRTHPYPSA